MDCLRDDEPRGIRVKSEFTRELHAGGGVMSAHQAGRCGDL